MDKLSTSNVVYRFTCPDAGCKASNNNIIYLGYTTCTLKERLTQHYYKGAIREHGEDIHNERTPKNIILSNTEILYHDQDA